MNSVETCCSGGFCAAAINRYDTGCSCRWNEWGDSEQIKCDAVLKPSHPQTSIHNLLFSIIQPVNHFTRAQKNWKIWDGYLRYSSAPCCMGCGCGPCAQDVLSIRQPDGSWKGKVLFCAAVICIPTARCTPNAVHQSFTHAHAIYFC